VTVERVDAVVVLVQTVEATREEPVAAWKARVDAVKSTGARTWVETSEAWRVVVERSMVEKALAWRVEAEVGPPVRVVKRRDPRAVVVGKASTATPT
jgi:hypothetical protein